MFTLLSGGMGGHGVRGHRGGFGTGGLGGGGFGYYYIKKNQKIVMEYKPTPEERIKELTKAGALIAAQIDYELNKVK